MDYNSIGGLPVANVLLETQKKLNLIIIFHEQAISMKVKNKKIKFSWWWPLMWPKTVTGATQPGRLKFEI